MYDASFRQCVPLDDASLRRCVPVPFVPSWGGGWKYCKVAVEDRTVCTRWGLCVRLGERSFGYPGWPASTSIKKHIVQRMHIVQGTHPSRDTSFKGRIVHARTFNRGHIVMASVSTCLCIIFLYTQEYFITFSPPVQDFKSYINALNSILTFMSLLPARQEPSFLKLIMNEISSR
jgi:hypothetical protein